MLLRADEEGRQREIEKHGGGWSERTVQEEIIRAVEEWRRRWEKQMQPLFCSLVDPDGKRVKQTQGSAQAGATLRLFLQLCFFNGPSRRQLGQPQRRPAWHHRQGCWKAEKHGVSKETNTEGDKMKTRGRPEEEESSDRKRSALMVQNCLSAQNGQSFIKEQSWRSF